MPIISHFSGDIQAEGYVTHKGLRAPFKAAGEDRASTTSESLDSDLFVNIDETGSYGFRIYAWVNSASFTPGISFGVGGSASGNVRWFSSGNFNMGAHDSTSIFRQGSLSPSEGTYLVKIEGVIQAIIGGSFGLMWSQAVSSGTATTVEAGSYMEFFKLGV